MGGKKQFVYSSSIPRSWVFQKGTLFTSDETRPCSRPTRGTSPVERGRGPLVTGPSEVPPRGWVGLPGANPDVPGMCFFRKRTNETGVFTCDHMMNHLL